DRVRIECDAPGAAFLVLTDAWFPGWSATLDGAALPIARVDYLVRGVRLPEGRHVVEMRYMPAGWNEALPWTRGCLALVLLAAVALASAHLPPKFGRSSGA